VSSDAIITVVILAVTIALLVSDRLRLDVVAMLSLLALALTGIVPVDVALSGFANPTVLMLAGLFVVGAALTQTGVAVGRRLERVAGPTEARTIVVVMATTAAVSAFMSSTGTVAILLPIVGTIAVRRGIAPGRLLMPLAFGAHLGSNLTLISTPPNLVVSDTLREAGHGSFRFFDFLVPGVAVGLASAFAIAPEPLLMGVAFASSAAFATPIASPVNVLVMVPGNYRFADYTRLGLPRQLLVLATAVLVIPLVWPFVG